MTQVKEEAIVAFVRTWWKTHPYGPSIRDIQEGFGLASASTAFYRVQKLASKGLLVHSPEIARGISLPKETNIEKEVV